MLPFLLRPPFPRPLHPVIPLCFCSLAPAWPTLAVRFSLCTYLGARVSARSLWLRIFQHEIGFSQHLGLSHSPQHLLVHRRSETPLPGTCSKARRPPRAAAGAAPGGGAGAARRRPPRAARSRDGCAHVRVPLIIHTTQSSAYGFKRGRLFGPTLLQIKGVYKLTKPTYPPEISNCGPSTECRIRAISIASIIGQAHHRRASSRAGGSIHAVRLYGEPTHLAKGHG